MIQHEVKKSDYKKYIKNALFVKCFFFLIYSTMNIQHLKILIRILSDPNFISRNQIKKKKKNQCYNNRPQKSYLPLFIYLFLQPHQWHMEVPQQGVESGLQLWSIPQPQPTPDLSCICNVYHRLQQCWVPNPLIKPTSSETLCWDLNPLSKSRNTLSSLKC